MPQYNNTPVFITEGKALYVPRLTGLDKFNRHSLTIVPSDQAIVADIEELYNELIQWLIVKNTIDPDVRKAAPPWRPVPNDKGMLSLSYTWSDKDMDEGYVYLTNEDDQPFNGSYKDQSLMGATFKLSFQLKPYCFTPNGSDQMVYGVKLKPRKVKLLEIGGLDVINPPETKELVGAEF